jgi:molybdopterin-binding protein
MSVRNVVPGEVKDIRMSSDSPFAEVIIRVGNQLLHARITRSAVTELELAVNSAVYALIKSVSFDQSS